MHPQQNLTLGSSSSQTLAELDKISGTESSASRDGSAFDELSKSVKDRLAFLDHVAESCGMQPVTGRAIDYASSEL